MNYFEIQEAVYRHLWEKHQQNNNFTFSVRQKASKGAENNYFIGKEKSSYFGFTCWDIPVFFPGSSSDLTNFIFTVRERCFVRFQYGNMIKTQSDAQSVADLEFGFELLKNLTNGGLQLPPHDEKNKNLYYYYELNPKGYATIEEVLKALDELYTLIAPVVDQTIAIIKQKHPDWQAGRLSGAKFNSLIQKMQMRMERFAAGTLRESEIEDEKDHESVSVKRVAVFDQPANLILYGPPGTGKTYHTIDKALQIIDGDFYEQHKNDRKTLTEKFRSLLIDDWVSSKGQIAFTTFHQSMSYEDFVEGIKPLKPKSGEQLTYDIEDGIFKRLCKLARSNFESSQKEFEVLPFEDAFEKLKEEWEEDPYLKFPLLTKGYDFTIIGFTSTSIQFKKSNGSTSHTLSINTLKEQYYGKKYDFKQGVGIYYPSILNKLHSYSNDRRQKIEPLNFILIIDEINRGNVSQIFGELITMIEEDKRIGNQEALEVMLPYSKERFGVPGNVFIIGTMNTADRSVEALDTALRRRFSFVEVRPDPSLLHPKQMICSFWNKPEHIVVKHPEWMKDPFLSKTDAFYKLIGFSREKEDEIHNQEFQDTDSEHWLVEDLETLTDGNFSGVNLHKLLRTINVRLEKLLSKDHQIGHAFFIDIFSIEELYVAFFQKLIPQLQEYFYGDFGKIGLVLGSSFVTLENQKQNLTFASFDYEDSQLLLERKIYTIHDFMENSTPDYESFFTAVKTIY